MKSRTTLRPPDITLPPPFLPATFSGRQQRHDHPLASPVFVRTSGVRGSRTLSSNNINCVQQSPLPISSSSPRMKRTRLAYSPVTPIRPLPSLCADVICTPLVNSGPQKPLTSMSSWIDEDSASELDTPAESSRSPLWTTSQDRILCLALDSHLSDPRTTPFAGPTPPPTLIHRIAKAAIRLAREHDVDLMSGHALSDIRKRIAQMSSGADGLATDIARPMPSSDAGMDGLRVLREGAAISADAIDSYFPLPLQSPFHESRNAKLLQETLKGAESPTSGKRKFQDLEGGVVV
ncbi:hypothetical protein V1525DRAFT_412752 [Lipomyces kononenkoae]|uniref:Uncharacterized protein n=1 Tax=Lipomyces kononenkoae TaxID=34357 RepID=A0ACC3SSE9_LIPKO